MAGTKLALGRGNDCIIMDAVISGTTPIVSKVINILDMDEVGLQLIVEFPSREFPAKTADAVVASTHTWTLANGGFLTTDVNGTMTVSNAANSNNNAKVTISSRTSATVVVTNGTQTNETFTAGVVPGQPTVPAGGATVLVVPPTATGAGTWLIEASNDYEEGGVAGLGQVGNADLAHWSPITAIFLPAITAPDGSTAAKQNQATQATILAFRAFRVTFTPSAGAGNARVIMACKSQS